MKTGCGSAWLERLVWDQEVAGSNPVTPIDMRVQFNGRTPAFQAGYVGSIPITRFCYVLNQEPGRQSGDRAPDLQSVIYVYKALKTRSKMSKSVN